MKERIIADAWKQVSDRVKKSPKVKRAKQKIKQTLLDYVQKIVYKNVYSLLNIPVSELEFVYQNIEEFHFEIPKIEIIYAKFYLKHKKVNYSPDEIRKHFRSLLIKAHLEGKTSFEVYKSLMFYTKEKAEKSSYQARTIKNGRQ